MTDARVRFLLTLRLYGVWFSFKSAAFAVLLGAFFFALPILMFTNSGVPDWVVVILAVLAGMSAQAMASSGDPDLRSDTTTTTITEELAQTLPITRVQRVSARLLVSALPSLILASLPILAAPLVLGTAPSLSVSFVLIMLGTAPLDGLITELGWHERWRIDGATARKPDSWAIGIGRTRARSPWLGYASLLFAASARPRSVLKRSVARFFGVARPAFYAFVLIAFFALLDIATGEDLLPGFAAGSESVNYMLLNLSAVALMWTPMAGGPFSGYELALRLLPVRRTVKFAILLVRQTLFAFVLAPWLVPPLVLALGTLFGRPGFDLRSAGGYLNAVGTSALGMVVALPLQQLLVFLAEAWHVITGRGTSDVSRVAPPVFGTMLFTTLLATSIVATEAVARVLFSPLLVLSSVALTVLLVLARVPLGRRLL